MSTEPGLTLKDWEMLYNMNKQLETKVALLESELVQLKEHTPQTNLFNKYMWVRILTVGIYVIIWQIALSVLLLPTLWSNILPIGIVIAVVVIMGLIIRKMFNGRVNDTTFMHRMH